MMLMMNLKLNRIQPIANAIRTNAATHEHLQQSNETSELVNSLKEKYEAASEEVKNQVRASVERILGLVPNLDKIKTALANLFAKGDQTATDQAGPLNEVKNLMKTISDTFKQAVQTTIVPAVKNNSSTSEHLTQVDTLIGQIRELQQKANQLSESAKSSVDANLQKILALLSNLETLKQRISSIVSAAPSGSNPTPKEQERNNGTDAVESTVDTSAEPHETATEVVKESLDDIGEAINRLKERLKNFE
jgi:hypothetical protein